MVTIPSQSTKRAGKVLKSFLKRYLEIRAFCVKRKLVQSKEFPTDCHREVGPAAKGPEVHFAL